MARLNTFIIQFHSFGNGIHEFSFDVDDTFFAFFTDSEINHGKVDIKVVMKKDIRQLQFDISIKGFVQVPCDLCLDPYSQAIDSVYTLYGKYGEGKSEEELDVIWISDRDYEVDLASYIYEYIVLSLPMKRIHPDTPDGESGCDEDMLERLNDIVITTDE